MNSISEQMNQKKFSLIASLPKNDIDLALAAQNGGADFLKVHLNVEHAASGTKFGSFESEFEIIKCIIDSVDIPVGIMPGSVNPASFEEMLIMEKQGISFYDIYIEHMPVEYMKLSTMEPMVALSENWRREDPGILKSSGFKMLEASIINHSAYGQPLVLSDLLSYSFILNEFEGKVVVPTQKEIKPSELPELKKIGVSGVMIGKIVTGEKPNTFEKATSDFRKAINAL